MHHLYWVSLLLYGAHSARSQTTSSTISGSTNTVAPVSTLSTSLAASTSTVGFTSATATSVGSSLSSSIASATITAAPTSASAPTNTVAGGASFPPVGSISRDYSPSGLAQLWDVVGPVEAPPFTTTVVPRTPIPLPSHPPPLYPSFYAAEPKNILPDLKFPKGFFFGVASAAYQVEGAVKDEGKGPSMWDWASRQPGGVMDNTTADVVDLHYFLYKEDVARIAALGVNAHSFSISWARIFPFGARDSPVNQEGLDHYRDVIDYHLESGVTPVVTLFHWDTPLALDAYYGGFTSPEIVDDFIHYAKTVFTAYNGSVHTWYTFNEPRVFCEQVASYPFNVTFAPGVNISTAGYQCSYQVLKAHAGAVKAFREMGITGEIAYKNDDYVGVPWRSNNTEDQEAVERHVAFQLGLFADPIYNTGDWPQIAKDTLPPEFLPRLTEEEQKDILGSADFFAIDAYRTYWNTAAPGGIAACVNDTQNPNWPSCSVEMFFDFKTGWAAGPAADPLSPWLHATPQFLRGSFKEYHRRWPSPKIYFAEYGFTEPFEGVRTPAEIYHITEDVDRTNYYMTYLGELLQSINEDGVPVEGAFAWAIMDNAEWADGLSARFGIQYVNYSTPTLERTYKRSAFALSDFFGTHLL